MVITLSGKIISKFPLTASRCISASNSTLYFASGTEGIYHSTDGSLSWTMFFLPLPNQSSEVKLWQVIKFNGGETDKVIFWATVHSTLKIFRCNTAHRSLKWKAFVNSHSVLLYDSNDIVFVSVLVLTQNAIYVLFVKSAANIANYLVLLVLIIHMHLH